MAATKKPVLECRFYRTASGAEPVRDWLKSLPASARREIGADIGQVQWTRPVGKVRSRLDGNIFRVLFCLDGSVMVLLHGVQKKARKTPKADIDLARRRMKDAEKQS